MTNTSEKVKLKRQERTKIKKLETGEAKDERGGASAVQPVKQTARKRKANIWRDVIRIKESE